MRKKIYVFFIIIICIIMITGNVLGYKQSVADYDMISNQPLESIQKQLLEISNDYVSYNDNMYATINLTVRKKIDEDGNVHYLIGNGDRAIEWTTLPEYLFPEEGKDNWDVWLDVQYMIYENPASTKVTYNAYVQCVYLDDTGDFNPEKDGWKGTKALDGAIKKGGEVVGGAINAVGGFFNLLTKIPGFIGGLNDLKNNFQHNFIGTIFTMGLDLLKFVADVFQIVANSFQTMNIDTFSDMTITYSADYLYTDGLGKTGDKGSTNRDMYTKIGECEEEDEEEENTIYVDGEKEGFTKDTPIPVIQGDLYYISLGNIEILDTNFLTIDKEIHKKEDSNWIKLRNFVTSVIHVTIYVVAAFLVIMLIVYGIRIVGHTFDNPEGRAEYIEGLHRFARSLLMLIGTVVIMAISIYGSKAIFNDIKTENSNEGPIRVNVKSAGYSFSTTVTGYFRYMAEIEDVDQYLEKAVYTFSYVALVAVNFVVMIFMFFRMLGMMILAIVGPIVTILEGLNIQGGMRYRTWVGLYVRLAFVQVIMAIMYRIILKCLI